ncbi:MAG: beta strand repeat-containing protein, partial [Crocinitomicaceae bacterium]
MLLSPKGMALLSILGISLFVTQSSIAQTTDLLISEYVEGSSSNKYIEIFNGTGASIDLSNYELRLYSNGNSSPNVTNSLSGTLADGSTIVYSNSSATVFGGASTNLGATSFNGDDALELYNSTTGTTVDIFGVIGCDPGSQWISASNRTQNRTLRRNTNILSGVTTNPACTSSSGDFTTLETEWTEFPQDNVADLGSHSIVVNNAPVVDLGPDQAICNGTSVMLFSGGDGSSFLWSTGDTTENITVSSAGTYTVTVSNAFGSTSDDINISIIPPTDLFVTSPTICAGETAEICATVATEDLIISEYIEGSGLNKCIEIYNGTGASIDLSAEGYTIDITFNGGSSTASIPLSGVIDNGATHVICDNNADAGFLAVADQTTNTNLYNGDDAIVLSKAGTAVDIFGVINNDPGAQWSSGGNSTQNSTLIRNATVTGGVTTNPTGTGGSAFTTLGTEWTEGTFDDPSDLGSHTVTGTGTFAWSTGAATLCTSVTPATTTDYTFSYLDTEGCTTDITSTVTVSNVTVTAIATTILCNGETSDVTVTATGGVAPYTGVGMFSETAGTYTYTVTDANGCSGTATVTITEPTPIVAYTSCPEILCNGGTEQLAAFAFGGTAPYTGGGLFTVGAGSYFYTLTDANGCTDTITHVVTEPPVTVIASATATTIDCNGGTSTVTVSATGGASPYSGTGMFTVPAGTQSFTVTDGDGCTSTATVTITEPTALVVTATGTILCNGGTADVIVTATGGTAPYTGTGTFNVMAGTYNYTVTDANGCSETVSITVTEPAALVVSATATTIDCNGGTADITVTATGGTAPYTGTGTFSVMAGTYDYTVTDANGCSETVSITVTEPTQLVASVSATSTMIDCNGGTVDVTVTATGGTAPYTGTGIFNVMAGTYDYTVTDANGCSETVSITITEPTALVVSATATTIDCNGGTADITVTATGGTAPYTGTGTFSVMA